MNEINPNMDVNPLESEIKNLEAQISNIDVNQLDPNDNGKVLSPVVETTQQVPVTQEIETTETPDPIKAELERIKGQTQGKTPQEKFAYKLKLEAQRAKSMGLDVNEILGIKKEDSYQDEEEEKPLTRKDLEQILNNVKPKTQTATDLAMAIENEAERELHLYYIENVIRQSGDAEQDFKMAKTMVDAIKLKNKATLDNLKPEAKAHSTASSFQPSKTSNVDNFKLTHEEEMLYRDAQIRGINFTKEEILNMRKK